ncbi:MAG: hypothetical protein ABIH23_29995, partial [bacterium]
MAPKVFLIVLLVLFCAAAADIPAQDTAWVPAIQTEAEFDYLTTEDTSRADLVRTGKYTTPASDDPSLLQTVYQNVNRYALHLEFLVLEFPERFAGLT